MFFTYLGRELRRRSRQALVIALGLALGIGLTIAVSAASSGVKVAQNDVLKSLYGVGTDITVTQTATRGSGGGQSFGITGQTQDTTGTKTTSTSQDTARVAPGTGTLASTTLTKVQGLSGVSGAVGSISLVDFNVSGSLTQSFTQQPSTSPTANLHRTAIKPTRVLRSASGIPFRLSRIVRALVEAGHWTSRIANIEQEKIDQRLRGPHMYS